MKVCRKIIFAVVMVLLLSVTMVLPVSAAKPEKSDCGLLMITTNGEDIHHYMAVCVAEEDGNYVYSGNRPIQQQVGAYASTTNALEYNSIYSIEEDTEYDGVQGVYRFALKEKVQPGSQADVFREMAAVKKNDTVYFVHLDMDESDVFVMEKTTVASIRNGVLTTEDKLEKDSGNGDFSVIFNDDGYVVGFCKSGTASVPASGNSADGYTMWILGAGFAVGLLVWLMRRKKKQTPPTPVYPEPQWDDDKTTLDSETVLNDFDQPTSNTFALKCHGGYLNGRTYVIPSEGITIGREPDNTIRYPGQTPGISRHHVRIFWQNGQLILMDLGSSNGTYLNKTGRVPPMRPVSLNAGDVFYLGEKLNGFEISDK